MKNLLVCYLLLLFFQAVKAQETKIMDPYKARLVTTDIDNFWLMFDQLPAAKSKEDTLAILKKYYLDKASKGLQEYFEREKKNNKANIEQAYLTVLRKYPKYLSSIKNEANSINNYKSQIHKVFAEEKELYPKSHFPDTYFCIGYFNSGGTSLESGLFIGAEINCVPPNADYQEWGKNSWLQAVASPTKSVVATIAHENIHAQQLNAKDFSARTVLCNALQEGGAVFIVSLLQGQGVVGFNPRAYEYGTAHEKKIWEEFKKDMATKDMKRWFYNGGFKDFPFDMGYFVGYKICESYYKQAKDKKQAIKDIIEVSDCESFLQESKYGQQFQ